jgi:hypothetical protein
LTERKNIADALLKMATYRGAKADLVTLHTFVAALEGLDMRAFQVAMARISNNRPQQGETLFPSLGYILEEMDEARERFPVFSEGATEVNTTPVFADSKQKRLA